jgi:peptide/nickel transport system permease protein
LGKPGTNEDDTARSNGPVNRARRPSRLITRPGVLARLSSSRTALAGAVILSVFALAAIAAPLVAPFDPTEMQTDHVLEAPSRDHLLGTDVYGRDVLSRVVWGSRVSVGVSVAAVALASSAAIVLGLVAGYLGGVVDDVIMRLLDIMFAFPALLLAISLVAFLGPGLMNATLAIAVVYVPRLSRVVRGSVIAVKHGVFVEAAQALGARDTRIVTRHILPNCWSPLIVQCTVYLAYAVLTESSLSFLGLGVQPPTPSWGEMLSASRAFLQEAVWWAVFPGVALSATVLAFNFLGDGLRDALDPRFAR